MDIVIPSALIYPVLRSAMQSGGGAGTWILEFSPIFGATLDPLTGWPRATDVRKQVKLAFNSQSAAVAYATERGIRFEISGLRNQRKLQPKVYADNFRTTRNDNWTH